MTPVDGHNPAPVGRVNILFIAIVFSQPFRGYPKNRRQKITYRISRTNRCSPQDPSALKCISFCIGSCNLSRGFSFSLEGIDGNQHGISENAQAVIMKISPVSLHRWSQFTRVPFQLAPGELLYWWVLRLIGQNPQLAGEAFEASLGPWEHGIRIGIPRILTIPFIGEPNRNPNHRARKHQLTN